MRVKSDEKRQAILDTANRIFREIGFEKTSMSEIAAQVGGSKATLYNYFASKEELFVECMVSMVEHYLEDAFLALETPNTDLRSALLDFGRSILTLICSPETICSRRLIIAEAGRSGIGKVFIDKITARQTQLVLFIDSAMLAGKLRRADSSQATRQLRALLEGELFESCLLCIRTTLPSAKEIEEFSESAIDTFLRAYAPEQR